MDVGVIHGYLSGQSYWARAIPLKTLIRSLDHSLCFGGFLGADQIAFARVVTDRATFAYLGDVFVLPEHQGRGYARALMQTVMTHPDLQGLRRFSLVTSDAHGLYQDYGFRQLNSPDKHMERNQADIYLKTEANL
jgi:GNAT superfamily N-acetyltransferase